MVNTMIYIITRKLFKNFFIQQQFQNKHAEQFLILRNSVNGPFALLVNRWS